MRLKPLPVRKIRSILKRNGWKLHSIKGDHEKWKKDGYSTPVGFSAHPEIVVGVIRTIMNQSGKPRKQFANA